MLESSLTFPLLQSIMQSVMNAFLFCIHPFLSVSLVTIAWTPPRCYNSPSHSCFCFLPLSIYFRHHLQINLLCRPLKFPYPSIWGSTKLTSPQNIHPSLLCHSFNVQHDKIYPSYPIIPPKSDSISGLIRSDLIQTLYPCEHLYIGSYFSWNRMTSLRRPVLPLKSDSKCVGKETPSPK